MMYEAWSKNSKPASTQEVNGVPSRPQRRTSSPVSSGWIPPDPQDHDTEYMVTEEVLEEFVAGHDVSDILRELVQNEFDAKGTKAEIVFDSESLHVRGTGRPIDPAGWRRLRVMLGRGRVLNSDMVIEPKVNGIGSKNFGLRSLFQIGDTIYVRSGGRQTFLHLAKGAPKPFLDPSSRNRRGVNIIVPYRTAPIGILESFNPDKEDQALSTLSADLVPTLIKLAHPTSSKSLRELVVSSERCNRRIKWVQSASKIRTFAKNVTGVQRRVHITEATVDGSGKPRRQSIGEIEFQKSFGLPDE